MLSYRHGFHAGNFADVLKHSVLTLVLDYMTRKEKGITYIDTHSGAGMYSLQADFAQKTGEYLGGIAKIYQDKQLPEELTDYVDIIAELNQHQQLAVYPGSPGIAKALLRKQDSIQLFELHPSDAEPLAELFARIRKANVHNSDGYQGALGLLPPPSRRGVMLIDPPFELKTDYQDAVKTIIKAYNKFATGTYLLWYPVVKRHYIEQMEHDFLQSDVRNLLQVELCLQEDSDEYGMTGTGLFVVNPPWQLQQQLDSILPYLTKKLGGTDSSTKLIQLIAE